LSLIISDISRSIDKIFAIDIGAPLYNAIVRGTWKHKFRTSKFDAKKVETWFYRTVQKVFGHLELLKSDLQAW